MKWRKKDEGFALICRNLFIVHQSLTNNLFELGYIRSTINTKTLVPICNVSLLLSYDLHWVTYAIHITIILYTEILLSKFKFQFSNKRRLWTLYKDLLSSADVSCFHGFQEDRVTHEAYLSTHYIQQSWPRKHMFKIQFYILIDLDFLSKFTWGYVNVVISLDLCFLSLNWAWTELYKSQIFA